MLATTQITLTEAQVSSDPSQQQNETNLENVENDSVITPQNIMSSKFAREYKDLLNILSKKNNVEGTCSLLKKCIKENIIPTPFNLANTDLYDKFCDASKKRWDLT